MGSMPTEEVDCLIVGAGFGALTLVKKLRDLGYSVSIYEKGGASGGIWYWNCYPGARVDSDTPIYQLFDKELWQDFTFSERYAGWEELRKYFKHVDEKWNVSAHVSYNKEVERAQFDESRNQWLVECADGSKTYCRWFLPCIGFASKRYTPPFPGLENFKGDVYHTAVWPQEGADLKGKRVAHFGFGASGIQVIQEIGDDTKHMTLYLRTPNFCLPMNQRKLDPKEEERKKQDGTYEREMEKTRHTFAAFTYDFVGRKTFDDSPEEREKLYHSKMIEEGGFRYWLNTYDDLFWDMDANHEAYKFWRKSVLKRIKDPKKQKLLAPEKPPHPWGTKRPSLEQRFYEVVDQPHIDIIDVNESPVEEVTATGIRTKEGLVEVDVIIMATGFDAVTGSLSQLDIVGTDGKTIGQHWEEGLRTATGVALNKFPNMFFLYGPQAPTAFSNGPSCTQFQAEWLEKFLKRAKEQGITRIEATKEAEDEWYERMHFEWNRRLFPHATGWYSAGNIPGKRVEPLNWCAGMTPYLETLDKSLENDYQGWKIETKA